MTIAERLLEYEGKLLSFRGMQHWRFPCLLGCRSHGVVCYVESIDFYSPHHIDTVLLISSDSDVVPSSNAFYLITCWAVGGGLFRFWPLSQLVGASGVGG